MLNEAALKKRANHLHDSMMNHPVCVTGGVDNPGLGLKNLQLTIRPRPPLLRCQEVLQLQQVLLKPCVETQHFWPIALVAGGLFGSREQIVPSENLMPDVLGCFGHILNP